MKGMIATNKIRNPNPYVLAVNDQYKDWVFDEVRALENKNRWRSNVFKCHSAEALDVEIGTGNGLFFTHRLQVQPLRQLVGLEIKFKPLIQSIRRALKQNLTNGRMVRLQGERLDEIFSEGEIDDVFIFFPDPWEKRKRQKNRLVRAEFLDKLFKLQKPGSKLEFKTDHADYFNFALDEFKKTPYKIIKHSSHFHQEDTENKNFKTHFESLFHNQGLPIYYCQLERP